MNHFQKLFKLIRTHKKTSIKVGLLVGFHSISFLAIPLLFKGTQMISTVKKDINELKEISEILETLKTEKQNVENVENTENINNTENNKNQENKEKKINKKNQNEKENKDKGDIKKSIYNKQLEDKLKKKIDNLSMGNKYMFFMGGAIIYISLIGILTKLRIIQSRKLEDLFSLSLRKNIFNILFRNRKSNLNTSIVVQKAVNDVNIITTSLAMCFINGLRGFIFGIGGIGAIFYYFPQIGFFTIIYAGIFAVKNKYYFENIQEASKKQFDYLENLSKELGQFSNFKKSVFLSDSKNFTYDFFSFKLYENHDKIMNLANFRGRYFYFLEVFGIGYILSIVCYGTYLLSSGVILAHNLPLALYGIYGVMGIRTINTSISELKEKNGILKSMENYFDADLTKNIEDFEICKENMVNYNSETSDKFFLSKNFFKYLEFEKYILKNFKILDSMDMNKNNDLEILKLKLENFLKNQRNITNIHIKNLKINEFSEGNKKIEIIIDKLILKNGICTGIKGSSGIGKTSLVDMINDFREVEKGKIKIKKEFPDKKTRYFYFTQVPEIFERNFIFNIILGNVELVEYIFDLENFSDEQKFNILFLEIKRVLKKSKLWYKIEKNHNLDYLNKFSAGEKQKLIFGRLFFSNSDVIFMDESISNLDEISKNLILKELKDYLLDKNSVFISHNNQSLVKLCGENIIEIKKTI